MVVVRLRTAVRSRLMRQIIDEQLPAALALSPTHLLFNAGGNDMLRPRVELHALADGYVEVLRRCDAHGVRLIVLSGSKPSQQVPMNRLFQLRGAELTSLVVERMVHRGDVAVALNCPDEEFRAPRFLVTGPTAPERARTPSRRGPST
jgi:hypothetical protein